MQQQRKNVRSTKQPFEIADTSSLRGKKERDVYIHVYDTRETTFSDQTGRFPTRSRRGNKYIMCMVEIDSNAILVEPMSSRKDKEMQRAYKTLLNRLRSVGIVPKKHVMDNEISTSMKEYIKQDLGMDLELIPPNSHRRNAAEVAIRNFKCHFLSILAGVAVDFPLSLWDRLLPQTELTLNLLRSSNATPTVSAHAHLYGAFDYNKMPLAPMGCKAHVHQPSENRRTWGYHSVEGWYLYTSPEHYRTHNCHVKDTGKERLSESVKFLHKAITNPSLTATDKLMNAMSNLNSAIKQLDHDASDDQLRDLSNLVNATTATIAANATPVTRVDTDSRVVQTAQASLPRVEPSSVPTPQKLSKATTKTRDSISVQPILRRSNRLAGIPVQSAAPKPIPSTNADKPIASRTRSKSKRPIPTRTNISSPAAGPATRTRSKTKLAQTIQIAAAVQELRGGTARSKRRPSKQARKLAKRLIRVENEVNQAMAVMDQETGRMLNYRALLKDPKYREAWLKSAANEFGRLAQGVGDRIKGTNTIQFIHQSEVPPERMQDVTYGQFVCTIRPEKDEQNRTRLVVGGDRVNYPGEVATPTAEMLVAKILFNSVISTPGARFMTMDVGNFYLNTPLPRPEFLRIHIDDIPEEIIQQYGLRSKVTAKGFVYVRATKGMYGLPQAGLLANELLEKRLNAAGYYQSKLVPGLWSHEWRPIQFTLVVDDFGVKYSGKEHAEHLESVLKQHYPVKTEWDGKRYIGIFLDWDYNKQQVHLSIPGYKDKALKQFNHPKPKRPQNQPFPHTQPKYGAPKQYAKEESNAPPLDKKGKRFIQQVCGKFLFLGRAVDSSLLVPISAIASQAANPTTDTLQQANQLLDYIATQEDAIITYSASDMILNVHSDAGYLNEAKARSRAGGHFFLSTNKDSPPNNGAILNIAHIIKNVMSSATEAELAALYIMAREAVYVRIILEELGHKQPPTPLQTDNACAEGVINHKIQPKRTKAMDMRFHWLRDRQCQEQFRIYWKAGKLNYADYWTKHHAAKHHAEIRSEFLTPQKVLDTFKHSNIEGAMLVTALARVC